MLLKHKAGFSLGYWCWEAIPLDSDINAVPDRKKLALDKRSAFHKAASNISHTAIASHKHSSCVLYTVQHAVTAYSLVQQPVQCSMLRMLLCNPTSFAYCKRQACGRALLLVLALYSHNSTENSVQCAAVRRWPALALCIW